MRRVMLVVVGFGAGVMMLCCLVISVQAQMRGEVPRVYVPRDVFYPRSVMGTNLLAVRAVEYDGPFMEDGSHEEVAGVAALIVENQGGLLVVSGAVIVEFGEERMVFELSFLPPGGKVLVLEKERKHYTTENPVTCYGWTREEYPENPGLVSVEPTGLTGLTITNHTGCTVPSVQVHYKKIDPKSGMYIGGISYCLTETDLMPREVRVRQPEHFATRETMIVQVLQDMAR